LEVRQLADAETDVEIDTAARVQYRPAQDWRKSKISSVFE